MKVTGVNNNKVINLYGQNKRVAEKNEIKQKQDSIQISQLGKSLSSYSIDENFANSNEKIEALKKEVSNGTYNRDSKLLAQKMLDKFKGI